MKKISKELLLQLGLICILGISIWYIWVYQGIHYSYEETIPEVNNFLIQEMYEDSVVRQEFETNKVYLEGISLLFINLSEQREGTVTVKLINGDDEVLASSSHDMVNINPGEWQFFKLAQRLKKNGHYFFEVSVEDCSDIPYLLLVDEEYNMSENISYYANEMESTKTGVLVGYRYAMQASGWEKLMISSLCCYGVFLAVWLIGKHSISLQPYWETIELKVSKNKVITRILIIGILAVSFLLLVPNIAYHLKHINLDESWRYFLNIANQEGIIFGKDVFFTYGPLGYLCYMINIPQYSNWYWMGVAIWIAIIGLHIYMLIKLHVLFRGGVDITSPNYTFIFMPNCIIFCN